MVKKIIAIFFFVICNDSFADDDSGSYSSSNSLGSIDLFVGAGYSQIMIGGNTYTGYGAMVKALLPFGSDSNWYFGFGAKYDSVDSTANSSTTQSSNQQNSFNYTSAQAGIDIAFKLSSSFVDFQLNPYAYYGFYNSWTRSTNVSNTTNIVSTELVLANLNYGLGASLLFKIDTFYFGPSAYYSEGYMACDVYTDNFGNSYTSHAGRYEIYNYNLTLGMYL